MLSTPFPIRLLRAFFAVLVLFGQTGVLFGEDLAPGWFERYAEQHSKKLGERTSSLFKKYESEISKLADEVRVLEEQVGADSKGSRSHSLKNRMVELAEVAEKRFKQSADLYQHLSVGASEEAGFHEDFRRVEAGYNEIRERCGLKKEPSIVLSSSSSPVASPGERLNEAPARTSAPRPVEISSSSDLPAPSINDARSATMPPVGEHEMIPAAPVPTIAGLPASAANEVVAPASASAITTLEPASEAASGEGDTSRPSRLTARFQFESQNKNERYTAEDRALPNNMNQARLSLGYELDKRNSLSLDERLLHRKRTELVQENYLTFGFLHKASPVTTVAFKDVYNTTTYPENPVKNFRDNLAELSWNKKEGRWERLYQVSRQTRGYPNFSASDFQQLDYHHESTRFLRNGTLFASLHGKGRSYLHSSYLDYTENTLTTDYNRGFSGNKSELTLSNTYEKRVFGNESTNLFRNNYWDNFLSFRYELPVTKRLTWLFEDEYQKRRYPGDEPRGYAQLQVKTTAKLALDKKTRLRLGHQYIFNDENTVGKAHKNHILTASWDRKYSDRLKIKLDESYQRRKAVIGDTLDFQEIIAGAQATWRLPSKVELTWRNEYLDRTYPGVYFPDFRYLKTGLIAFFAKNGKYDWQLEQSYRTFSHRRDDLAAGWKSQGQPISKLKISWVLKKDLRLNVAASQEKTYYKTFDTLSQDLLWDFNRPLTNSEFTGSLDFLL